MTAAAEPEPIPPAVEGDRQPSASPADGVATVVLPLPATPEAVGQARRAVVARWEWLDDEVLSDVELVVAELVSNAVQHGEPTIEVRLRVEPFAVDVAVLDHGPGQLPDDTSVSASTATSGRGLAIVDQLASFWGVEALPDGTAGKIVWASLSR